MPRLPATLAAPISHASRRTATSPGCSRGWRSRLNSVHLGKKVLHNIYNSNCSNYSICSIYSINAMVQWYLQYLQYLVFQVVLVTAAQVNPWLQLHLGRELLVLAVT